MNEELKFSEAIDKLRHQKQALEKEMYKAINSKGRGDIYTQYIAGRFDQSVVILNAMQEISCKHKLNALEA